MNCKCNVHKRCIPFVPNLCGIDQKTLAQELANLGMTAEEVRTTPCCLFNNTHVLFFVYISSNLLCIGFLHSRPTFVLLLSQAWPYPPSRCLHCYLPLTICVFPLSWIPLTLVHSWVQYRALSNPTGTQLLGTKRQLHARGASLRSGLGKVDRTMAVNSIFRSGRARPESPLGDR